LIEIGEAVKALPREALASEAHIPWPALHAGGDPDPFPDGVLLTRYETRR